MDEALIQRLETSFKLLAPRGEELVDRFYANLFARHPGVRPMFPGNMSAQKKKLLSSLVLVVNNLRKPDTLKDALLGLGGRHQDYGVEQAHYGAVRDTLVDVMQDMAGDAWNDQWTRDWKDAINLVAGVMVEGQHLAAAASSN